MNVCYIIQAFGKQVHTMAIKHINAENQSLNLVSTFLHWLMNQQFLFPRPKKEEFCSL